jgi:hypothetical protein
VTGSTRSVRLHEAARQPFRWLVELEEQAPHVLQDEDDLALFVLASWLLAMPLQTERNITTERALQALTERFPMLKSHQLLRAISFGLSKGWLATEPDYTLSIAVDSELATLVTAVATHRGGGQVYIGNDTEPQAQPVRITLGEGELDALSAGWHDQAANYVRVVAHDEVMVSLVVTQLPSAIDRWRRGRRNGGHPVLPVVQAMLEAGEENDFLVAEIVLATLRRIETALERKRQPRQPDE